MIFSSVHIIDILFSKMRRNLNHLVSSEIQIIWNINIHINKVTKKIQSLKKKKCNAKRFIKLRKDLISFHTYP